MQNTATFSLAYAQTVLLAPQVLFELNPRTATVGICFKRSETFEQQDLLSDQFLLFYDIYGYFIFRKMFVGINF